MDAVHRAALIGLAMAGALSVPAHAQTIYKSVDQAGHVTYSTELPRDAVVQTLAPPPEPSPEDVAAAEEQYEQIAALGAEFEKARKAREAEAARLEAERQAHYAVAYTPVYVLPLPVFVDRIRPVGLHRFRPDQCDFLPRDKRHMRWNQKPGTS